VKPDITLVDYDGIEIEKPSAEITDEDVNERLHYLQFVNAVREPADVISDNEYVAHVTFREVDSIEEPQKSEIYLGDKRIVDELRSLLIGKKPGEIFTADLPRSEGDGSMKNVKVEVTVNNIDKVILPEITEEFCKTISREKAVTELEVRKLIREELEETSRRNADQIMESNMVNALLSRHNFEVPQTLTYALIDANIEEARRRNQQQGLPADHGIDIEQIRKVYWTESEQRAKWLLLREKLIEAEQIEVSDADIEELASKDAAMYGISPENLLTYYKQNEDIRERIRSQKLVDALKQKFIITETTKQA
jgi:trigger factor